MRAIGAKAYEGPAQFVNLDGKLNPTTWDAVFAAVTRFNKFFSVIQGVFYERDDLIVACKLALCVREHVLIYGGHGRGKTAVCDMIAKNVRGATAWSMDLSRGTTESHLFGDIDAKKALEESKIFHRTDGSLVQAHIANIGEFFDANVHLLRSLLRVLNERAFIRGPQKEASPLISAFANTNFDPYVRRQRSEELAAVVDRFLFWVPVDNVKQSQNRLMMLRDFLDRRQDVLLPELTLDDVVLISGVVLALRLTQDEYVLQCYEELARKFAEARKQEIPDRRFLKAAQIPEASAILNRRTGVTFEDMRLVGHALVERPEEWSIFDQVLGEVVGTWNGTSHRDKLTAEMEYVEQAKAKIPTTDAVTNATNIIDVVKMRRDLLELQRQVRGAVMTSSQTSARQAELLAEIETTLACAQAKIDQA